MHCIFCKRDSSASRSIEHVIPESLGNTEHVLGAGIVCDQCNSYFASNVEGPLLSDPYFRDQCSRAGILTKKGRPHRVRGLHPQSRSVIELIRHVDGSGMSVGAAFEKDEQRWVEAVSNRQGGRIYIPAPLAPDEALMSRFLAKVAVECLALRMIEAYGDAQAIVSEEALDSLRKYARKGPPQPVWPFLRRSLYPADHTFVKGGQESYEVLHEWVFTITDEEHIYFVLALFGVEYALNVGQRRIDSYQSWVNEHFQRSPLYPDGL